MAHQIATDGVAVSINFPVKVSTVSVLAPGVSTMPLRSGFVWDEATGAFKYDPFLRQVRAGWGVGCRGF
jgi:hypothetical protein